MKCGFCMFYKKAEEENRINCCVRFPPTPVAIPVEAHSIGGKIYQHKVVSYWPYVRPEEICGEFKLREPYNETK